MILDKFDCSDHADKLTEERKKNNKDTQQNSRFIQQKNLKLLKKVWLKLQVSPDIHFLKHKHNRS